MKATASQTAASETDIFSSLIAFPPQREILDEIVTVAAFEVERDRERSFRMLFELQTLLWVSEAAELWRTLVEGDEQLYRLCGKST